MKFQGMKLDRDHTEDRTVIIEWSEDKIPPWTCPVSKSPLLLAKNLEVEAHYVPGY